MKLDGLIWQQGIWKGPMQVVVTNIRELEVYECKRLRHVFPVILVQNLHQLSKLNISNCEKLEQIIVSDDDMPASSSSQGYGEKNDKGMVIFPRLKELYLVRLPCLVRFGPVGYYHLVFPSLEKLVIEDCCQMITSFTADSRLSVHAKTKVFYIPPLWIFVIRI